MWPFVLALGLIVAGVALLFASRRATRAAAPRPGGRERVVAEPSESRGKTRPSQAALATPSMIKREAAKAASKPVSPAPKAREKPVPPKPASAPKPAERPAPPAPAAADAPPGRKKEKVDRIVEAVKAEFEQLLKAQLDPERPGGTPDPD